MSDELAIQPQVQQKQSNPLLYAGLGAAAGAGAGYVGARYTTDPKYASYEDIIKEADDKFESTVKEAISGEAEQTKAIDARKSAIKARDKWTADKNAFVEANKEGAVIPDDNYRKLEGDLNTAEETLEKKRTALAEKEAEALRKNNTGVLTDKEKKVADTLNKKIEGIEASKNTYISDRKNAIDAVNTKISEPRVAYTYTEFGKPVNAEGNAFEQLVQRKNTFEKTISSVESHLKDKKFKKGSELTFVDPKTKKVVTRVPANTQEVKLAKQYFEKAYQTELATMFAGVDKGILNSVADEAAIIVQNNVTNNESIASKEALIKKTAGEYATAKADIPTDAEVLKEVKKSVKKDSHMESLLNKYATATDPKVKANAMDSIRASYFMAEEAPLAGKKVELETQQLYKKIQRVEELTAKEGGFTVSGGGVGRRLGRWLGVLTPVKLTASETRELKNIQAELEAEETKRGAKEFSKIESDALKAKNVDAKIATLEGDIKTLEDSLTKRKTAQRKINTIQKQIEAWAGKGATIDASGNVIKADGSVFKPEATTNLASRVGIPINDPKVAGYDRQIANIRTNVPTPGAVLSEAEILEKAKANVQDSALKVEMDARNAAQKALDEAKAKLPKGAGMSEEEAVKKFIEKNGTVDEAMKKAFGEDVKALLERKIPNKKLALWLGGGAAALATLGYFLAPKNNQV